MIRREFRSDVATVVWSVIRRKVETDLGMYDQCLSILFYDNLNRHMFMTLSHPVIRHIVLEENENVEF